MTYYTRRRSIALTMLIVLFGTASMYAQEQVHFAFSGYIQAIMQYGTESDYIKVGKVISPSDQSTTRIGIRRGRIGIRRGRLATTATYGDLGAKIEINATEQSISIYNVYAEYKPHWAEGGFVKGGVMNPSFGYELPYSSSSRASFERSIYMADIFPSDIDMGVELGYKGTLDQQKRWLLESSLSILSGNANKGMIKDLPDLALRMALTEQGDNHQIAVGLSGYAGYIPSPDGYYAFDDKKATLKKDHMLRSYGGAFINSTLAHPYGQLMITAEGIIGLQPGWHNANFAIGSKAPETFENNIFVQRPFIAAMAMIVERLKPIDLELYGRYAYYDRNRHFDPTITQEDTLNSLTAQTEGLSHHLSSGINYFLYQDHLRLSLQYDCYLRQQIEEQSLRADTPLHVITVGAQYMF